MTPPFFNHVNFAKQATWLSGTVSILLHIISICSFDRLIFCSVSMILIDILIWITEYNKIKIALLWVIWLMADSRFAPSQWETSLLFMADSRFAPRQWETSLQSNAVCHWLGTSLKSGLWLCTQGKEWMLLYRWVTWIIQEWLPHAWVFLYMGDIAVLTWAACIASCIMLQLAWYLCTQGYTHAAKLLYDYNCCSTHIHKLHHGQNCLSIHVYKVCYDCSCLNNHVHRLKCGCKLMQGAYT